MGAETGGSEDILRVGTILDSWRVGAGPLTMRAPDNSHEGARQGTEVGILRNIFVVVFPGRVYEVVECSGRGGRRGLDTKIGDQGIIWAV